MCRKIVGLMPQNRYYLEPFCYGLNVGLNRMPCELEVAADINHRTIGFYKELQRRPASLIGEIEKLAYSRETFENRSSLPPSLELLVENRMSRAAMGRDFGWSDRLRGGQPEYVNAWEGMVRSLPEVYERIKHMLFLCGDAMEYIEAYSRIYGPDLTIYCDPPYLPETRKTKQAYEHEMTVDDHIRMLGVLLESRAKIFLSGYDSKLYRDALNGWKVHTFDVANNSGQGKTKERRTEILWESP